MYFKGVRDTGVRASGMPDNVGKLGTPGIVRMSRTPDNVEDAGMSGTLRWSEDGRQAPSASGG